MSHLQARPPETALDVEPLVVFAAVEDCLVAARLLRDEVEGLDDTEAQFLALLVFGDGNVFNVSDGPEIVDARGGGRISFLLLLECGGPFAYNLRSTNSPPVPTILGGLVLVSSMTIKK